GNVLAESGKVGAATRYPAAAHVSSKVSYTPGFEFHPWANTTSGSGPGNPIGRRMTVTRVRPGCPGTSPRSGVGRLGSVNVSVSSSTAKGAWGAGCVVVVVVDLGRADPGAGSVK